MRAMRPQRPAATGQALVLVALVLGVLVSLAVGVTEVALQRRTIGRVQQSLDLAAAAALTPVDTASLVAGTPTLDAAAAETRFRTRFAAGLDRVRGGVAEDPDAILTTTTVAVVPTGGRCMGQPVSGPALCAHVTVTVVGVFSAPRITFTTLAQATPRP